jgi:uncharacterized protein involved in response to NO
MGNRTPVFLSYAFRPFFAMNGLFAVAVMVAWVALMHGWSWFGAPLNPVIWHAHEMLIGFVMAAVAGFSLTAVATWTGRPPVNGNSLGWLAAAWLAGRVAMAFSGVIPAVAVMLIDLVFPVMLCLFLGREVIAGGSRRNYPVAAITGVMAVLNLLYHIGTGTAGQLSRLSLLMFIQLVLLLITIIAGRIIPNFTANWLRAQNQDQEHGSARKPRSFAWLEATVFSLTGLTGLAYVFMPGHEVTGVLALLTAAAHGLRLSQWCGLATRPEPLLFILHVAYAWLPMGFGVAGLAVLGIMLSVPAALHALTVGAVALMILAVATRVALGHTGRPLTAAPLVVRAYLALLIATLLRVLGPGAGAYYQWMIDLSALGWIIAFILFLKVYWPILTGPHAGDQPVSQPPPQGGQDSRPGH